MERRYQVFVSSTQRDLEKARAKVAEAIQQLKHMPTGMELWPAADSEAWGVIDSFLRGCDYYVLVIKGRYGSIDPASGKSYTQKEYERAFELKVPILPFIFANPGSVTKDESDNDPAAAAKLADFVKLVKERHHCKFWSNEDQLHGQVLAGLLYAIESTPRTGWVRGDSAIDSSVLLDLDRARKEIDSLKAKLLTASTTPPPGASELAGLNASWTLNGAVTCEQRKYSASGGSYEVTSSQEVEFSTTSSIGELFDFTGLTLWESTDAARFIETIASFVVVKANNVDYVAQLVRGRAERCAIKKLDGVRLLLQFRGLGLIAESETEDTKRITWALTPYGRSVLSSRLTVKADDLT